MLPVALDAEHLGAEHGEDAACERERERAREREEHGFVTLLRKPIESGIPEQGSFKTNHRCFRERLQNLMLLFKIGMFL